MTLIMTLISIFSIGNAAEITAVHADHETEILTLDVQYGGGCAHHSFELVNEIGCRESYPVQCDLVLRHDTGGDNCEAMIYEQIEFTYDELGITDSYYNGGFFTIFGDNSSKVYFSLPFIQ